MLEYQQNFGKILDCQSRRLEVYAEEVETTRTKHTYPEVEEKPEHNIERAKNRADQG